MIDLVSYEAGDAELAELGGLFTASPAAHQRIAAYNPDQPRDPAGTSTGGQWTSDLGSAEDLKKTDAEWDKLHDANKTSYKYRDESVQILAREMRKLVNDDAVIALALKTYDPYRKLDPRGQWVTDERGSRYIPWTEESMAAAAAEELANRFAVEWSVSSGDHSARAALYQYAVADVLGLDDVTTDHLMTREAARDQVGSTYDDTTNKTFNKAAADAVERVMRAHARAQYENTQRAIADGPAEWTVIRGFLTAPDDNATLEFPLKDRDGKIAASAIPELMTGRATLQPLSSFSTRRDIAEGFGRPGGGAVGVLVTTRVPRSRIFSMTRTGFGVLDEREVVLVGGKIRTRVQTRGLRDDPYGEWRDLAFNENQPRVPAGHPDGGQWTDGSGDFMQALGPESTDAPFEDARRWYEDENGNIVDPTTIDVATALLNGDLIKKNGETELKQLQNENHEAFMEAMWPNGMWTRQEAKAEVARLIGAHLEKEFTEKELQDLRDLVGAGRDIRPGATTKQGLAEGIASRITHQWANTSGDSNALSVLMQEAIAQEFDLEGADMDHLMSDVLGSNGTRAEAVDHAWSKLHLTLRTGPMTPGVQAINEENKRDRALLMRGFRAHARAQYKETQKALEAAGIDEVELVRGVGLYTDDILPITRTGTVNLQPASSFTTDFGTADTFASYASKEISVAAKERGDRKAVVIRARIPRKRILSFPRTGFGALNEHEVVVLGGPLKNTRAMVWW